MTPANQDQAAVKLAQLLKHWAESLLNPVYRERIRLVAKERRLRYLALVEAGFSEAQALEMCRLDVS
jgi:hypothetical protein